MQPPVENGDPQRIDGTLVTNGGRACHIGVGIVGITKSAGVIEVKNGFGHPKKQDADTDASREQHREPREVAKLRTAVVRAEAHIAVLAENDKTAHGQ